MNMIRYKSIVFAVFFVLLLSFVSAELNLKLTASINGLSSDFFAITNPFSDNGFDGSDVPFVYPPNNYVSLYSNITLQNGVNKLVLDSWNQSSNPRVLTLTFFTSIVQTGQLDLTWTGANGYDIVLNDYGADAPRQTLVSGGSKILSSGTGSGTYSVTGINLVANGVRYYTLVVKNTSGSVSDTTPPGPVSNLGYSYKTKNNIQWVWTNPSDADFDSAIVYADGVNVVNTSLGKYNATGLIANTSHTIRINTKDLTGNINYLNVSSSTITTATGNPVSPPNFLGPGTGGAGTGTIANIGSSGSGGGSGSVDEDGFLAPGDELPENVTAAQKIVYKTKNTILDYLAKQSKTALISYVIALIAAILLIIYGIKHRKQSKSSVHKKKIVKKKKK